MLYGRAVGRPRRFDDSTVARAATRLFLERGYEATSVDDLVVASGLHRGSLYKAFGSKRGIFLAALEHLVRDELPTAAPVEDLVAADTLDLLLVAAVELAPRDSEVRDLVQRACGILAERLVDGQPGEPAALLGRRLLHRAGAGTTRFTEKGGDDLWHG